MPMGVGSLAVLSPSNASVLAGRTGAAGILFLAGGARLGLVSFFAALDGHDRFTGSGCLAAGGSGSDLGGGGCCLPSLMVILPFCIWQGPSSSDRAAVTPVRGFAGWRPCGEGLCGAARALLVKGSGLRDGLECTGERRKLDGLVTGERIRSKPSGLGLLSMTSMSACAFGNWERMGVKESSSTRESSARDCRPMGASPAPKPTEELRFPIRSASCQLWVLGSLPVSGADPSLSELSESLPEPDAEEESSESLELESDDDIFSTSDGG